VFAGGWVLFHKVGALCGASQMRGEAARLERTGAEARWKINLKEVVRSSCATFSRPAFVRQEEEECFP